MVNSKICTGTVRHARKAPKAHDFSYQVYFFMLDLDELAELDQHCTGFHYNRRGLSALYDSDFLTPDQRPIRDKVMEQFRQAGSSEAVDRILLVTSARFLNHVFNPVSFYLALNREGRMISAVAEVNNTFGDRHVYRVSELEQVDDDEYRSELELKTFHVSPFNDMQGTYRFRFILRDDEPAIHADLYRDEQLWLATSLTGRSVPLTSANLRRTLLRFPLTAWLTLPRITWQAARLYFQRKLPVFTRPEPTHPDTLIRRPPRRRERLAMRVVFRLLDRMQHGRIQFNLPDGTRRICGHGGDLIEMDILQYRCFTRILFSGEIGLGEGYTEKDWDTHQPEILIALLLRSRKDIERSTALFSSLSRVLNSILHRFRRNTRRMSRLNIHDHYDLSNAFFEHFLDPTMMYSSAVYQYPGQDLESAQRHKLHTLIRKARIQPNHHILEIGSGWGSFAIEAVKETGCSVTTVTISEEQYEYVRQRIQREGLGDLIDVRLCDYRDIQGQFDRIVSIEMLEAVGHEYLHTYFEACHRLLKDDGLLVLQVITMPDARYDAYRKRSDWIRKHIFPGGHLPSLHALHRAMKHTDLFVEHAENIGPYYALTLKQWRERFNAHRDEIESLGFDAGFQRKWIYYLCYCEAAFAERALNNMQLVFSKPQNKTMKWSYDARVTSTVQEQRGAHI